MIFVSIDDISGNCTETGYEDWILVDSFSIGMSASLTSQPNNAERTTGKVNIQEMSFSKTMDVSSLLLAAACAGNKGLGDVIVCITRTEGDAEMLLVKYVLGNGLVSSISTSGHGGGGLPSESFSINFTSITGQYTKQKEDATAEGNAVFGWDMVTGIVKAPA